MYQLDAGLYISRRISAADASGNTSPAVKVAVASVAISLCVMIVAVSIVQGFRREIRRKVLGFTPHITLYDSSGAPLEYTPALKRLVEQTPGVGSAALSLSSPLILKTPGAFRGVYARGLDKDADTTFLHSSLVTGRLPRPGEEALLLSRDIAGALSVEAGDSVGAFLLSDEIRARRMVVSGIYNSHFENYDSYFVYTPLRIIQHLSGLQESQGTMIEVRGSTLENAERSLPLLQESLNRAMQQGDLSFTPSIETARERGAQYFAWLDMLDTNVWVILSLMSVVALFTLISGLLIIILEKVRFIGVMRALGAGRTLLRRIFLLLAMRIAFRGIAIGLGLAALLLSVQNFFRPLRLNPEAYYIDYVPVSLAPLPIVLLTACFITLVYCTLMPCAAFVGRISPSESMRFEN